MGATRAWARAAVLVRLAAGNLIAGRTKTLIAGGIIFGAAFFVLTGSSLLSSLDRAMGRSISGSVAGDIQVYSAESKGELALLGDLGTEGPTPIPDLARLERTLASVPNVKAVVPMGVGMGTLAGGHVLDTALEQLRALVRDRQAHPSAAPVAAYQTQKTHVRHLVERLSSSRLGATQLQDAATMEASGAQALALASSAGFWDRFDAQPLAALELLENEVAPQGTESEALTIRYLGTDLPRFARWFDRMYLVHGANAPAGERGLLVSRHFYESTLKLKVARRLDRLKEWLATGQHRFQDEPVQKLLQDNQAQVIELLLELDPEESAVARARLQRLLGAGEQDLAALFARFLRMDAGNFQQRYQFFYAELVPLMNLYQARIGDQVVIRSVTRTGANRSVALPLRGVFAFRGLERSPQAGALNLIDLASFEELYGAVTEDSRRDVADLVAGLASSPPLTPDQVLDGLARKPSGASPAASPGSGQHLALNAAVLLHDPSRVASSMAAIRRASAAAGMPMRAVPWQKSAGVIGQFVTMVRGVLTVATGFWIIVALIVLSNSLLISMLGRVPEVGTLRAIGASRPFVFALFLVEALMLGACFGGLGFLLAAAAIQGLGHVGIPAINDVFQFFFSGPRLHPDTSLGALLAGLLVVLGVCGLASVYPCWIAFRVSPRQAMQGEE